MYIPAAFRIEDWSIIEDLIQEWMFVDLIGVMNGDIIISKNPIIYKGIKEFEFHLANGNPLLNIIRDSGKIDVLISGPHEYISPTWYSTTPAVPTWNYVAIRVTLVCTITNDADWMLSHHHDLTQKYEKHRWDNVLSPEYRDKSNAMISGVSGKMTKFEAKCKLGQNRSDEDFTGIYHGLVAKNHANPLAAVMKKLFPGKILS